MKRYLLVPAILLALAGIWPAAAQQPFGTPFVSPPVVFNGAIGGSNLIAPLIVAGSSAADVQIVSNDGWGRLSLRGTPNGTASAMFGRATGADNIITGSVASDLTIRNTQAILFSGDAGSTVHLRITSTGVQQWSPTLFAALGTPANGSLTYCSDCTLASPCAGAGTGAFAKRLNAVWVCN
jgi:hypothetical protein